MHHGFHPKYPFKLPLDDLSPSVTPTDYQILLHPSVHGLDLLDTCSSLLVHLVVVSRGRKQAQVLAKFEAHQPPIPLSPLQGLGSLVTQTTQRHCTKFTLHHPRPNYQGPQCMHTIPANKFHEQNSSQIHPSTQPLQRRPTDNVSSQDKSPKAPTGLMKHIPCIQLHVLFKKFLHKAKAISPWHPYLLLSMLP